MAGQEGLRGFLLGLLVCVSSVAAPAVVPQRPGQPEVRVNRLESSIHELINRERTSRKSKALRYDERLAKIARAHSEDMAKRHFFSHINPDGEDPTARGERAGYGCHKDFGRYTTEGLAENIYQGNLYNRVRIRGNEKSYDWNTSEELARQSVKGWMNSSGHRRNILEKNYTQTGIGVAIAKDDKVYFTQLFC